MAKYVGAVECGKLQEGPRMRMVEMAKKEVASPSILRRLRVPDRVFRSSGCPDGPSGMCRIRARGNTDCHGVTVMGGTVCKIMTAKVSMMPGMLVAVSYEIPFVWFGFVPSYKTSWTEKLHPRQVPQSGEQEDCQEEVSQRHKYRGG